MTLFNTFILCVVVGLTLMVWYIRSLFKGPNYAALPTHYPFKTKAKAQQYHKYYDERAKEYPTPSTGCTIDTSFGKTYVRICGPEDAPPLVLLPSGFASGLIWLANIQELAQHFRIYAVDNIFDVGRSVNTRPVVDGHDLTQWLDELFTQLELGNKINLMGLSFGGWLASQYALRHPERLSGVVLAAPVATILPLPGAWAWRGILGAFPPHKFFMTHFMTNWMCQDLVKQGDEASQRKLEHWMNDAIMAMQCFTFRMPLTPTVLSDEELQSLNSHILFLVGEHEVIYPAEQAVQRIKTLAPSIVSEVIQNASHDLTISQTEIVNGHAISFLLGR